MQRRAGFNSTVIASDRSAVQTDLSTVHADEEPFGLWGASLL